MSNNLNQDRMNAFAQLTMLHSAIAHVAPGDRELAVIDEMMDKLQARRYTLAVVGEFNRGKSSLINALLGMSVLPADITPTTATINRVVYSDVPYARLHMKDGQVEEIPITMLKGRVTKLSDEAQSAAAQVEEAEIGYPTVFCKNNIDILDTPGLNESADMDELTWDRARQADALVYTIHALVPFSVSEAEAVCKLLEHPNIRHILFTVGFIDQVPAEEVERMLELIRKRIIKLTDRIIQLDETLPPEEAERRRAIISSGGVLGVSAKQALDAFVSGSIEQLQASGIEEYKKELMARLTAQQDEWLSFEIKPYLEKTTATFNDAVQRTLGQLEERIQGARAGIDSAAAALNGASAANTLAGNRWKEASRLAMGSQDQQTEQLRTIIAEYQLTADVQEKPAVPGGLFGWIRKKAEATGVFRAEDDPKARSMTAGFEAARQKIIREWQPAINETADQLFENYTREMQEKEAEILACLRTAAQNLHTESALPAALSEALNVEKVTLLNDGFAGQIASVQPVLAGIGTVENVQQRLARQLSDKVNSCINQQADRIRREMTRRVVQMQERGRALLPGLQQSLQALEAERNELQAQIASVRRFLLGEQENRPEENPPANANEAAQQPE